MKSHGSLAGMESSSMICLSLRNATEASDIRRQNEWGWKSNLTYRVIKMTYDYYLEKVA